MKIFILLLIALSLFGNSPYIYSTHFKWTDNGKIKNTYQIKNNIDTSFTWKIWFNDNFMKKYDGQKVNIIEKYEAEYPCWQKDSLKGAKLSNNNHIYEKELEFEIHRNNNIHSQKSFSYMNTWFVDSDGKEVDKEACKLYNTNISHDKIYIYANDMLLHTFKFTIIPKDYKEPIAKEKPIEYKHYEKPNYSELYKDTPQIILNKLHIYQVNKLSYFRKNKDIIFIEAGSGSYAVPREEFKSAKYLLLTQKLNKMLEVLELK